MATNPPPSVLDKKLERFWAHLPKLTQVLEAALYGKLPVDDMRQTFAVSGLHSECLETFEEICFVCKNGRGVIGIKLLRGLYERAVTATFLARNKDQVQEFIDICDLDEGKLLRRMRDFARANGEDASALLPDWATEKIEEDYERGKKRQEICPKCKRPQYRNDLASMAQSVGMDSYYGPAFLYPTFYVHASWWRLISRIKQIEGEHDIQISHRGEEPERLGVTLSLAHDIMLHMLEAHDRLFGLGLAGTIAQLRHEYNEIWNFEER